VKQVEHSLRSATGRRFAPAAKAAAAVALIAAALAACGAAPDGATPPARSIELAGSKALVQTKVPPYYVALVASRPEYPSGCGCPPPTDVADVRATTTGALLARVKPPRSYTFSAVSGAADDRTFVLFGEGPFRKTGMLGMYEYRSYSQRLFLLRIKPAASISSARAELTTLPQTDIAPGQQVQAIALSPDGKSLAAILTRRVSGFPYLVSQLTIFNLSNGTQRTWTRDVCYYGKCVQGPIGDWPPIVGEPSRMQLSWTSGGRSLLFIEGSTGSQVRLLDVDAPGRNVVADSYPLPIRAGVTLWRDAVITPDAKFWLRSPFGRPAMALMTCCGQISTAANSSSWARNLARRGAAPTTCSARSRLARQPGSTAGRSTRRCRGLQTWSTRPGRSARTLRRGP
jgi:hypothetical protein